MANEHAIKSEKILVKDIFSTMWFRIPEYQRPYIWSKDEVSELLDDLVFAQGEKPDQPYFLGSFVYQSKKANVAHGQAFNENDLLDGQQRITTLLMLFACIRDLSDSGEVVSSCQKAIFQKGDKIDGIPERTRIVFAIRPTVQEFVDVFVKQDGGTSSTELLEKHALSSDERSVRNMAAAILEMRPYLTDTEKNLCLEKFLIFLRNQVLLIFVATENLDDAFRLFTILNDRGVPLRNSDILKASNLGALTNDGEKKKYALLWEEVEGELGDEFDRFLNYIRTILVKEKARLNLLQEFEDKIYNPKEKDKVTGQKRSPLLGKGTDTFKLVDRYWKTYRTLLRGFNYDDAGHSFQFDNLIKVMLTGLPSSDWIPPLLRYFDRFGYQHLLAFATKLDNKFSADWITQYTPTQRIDNMNAIIRVIDDAPDAKSILENSCFHLDSQALNTAIDSLVYGRRFTRYLLIKLDYLYQDHAHKIALDSVSVEHILPQSPAEDSAWKDDFTADQRAEWTDRLGNLVLISAAKNSSQGRLDYLDKKAKYFSKKVTMCPNSIRVLQNSQWTPRELQKNHETVLAKLCTHYEVSA